MHQSKSCTVCDATEQRAGERSPAIVQLPNDHLSPSASSLSVVVGIQRYYKHGVPEALKLVSVDGREKAEQQLWFWKESNDRQAQSATTTPVKRRLTLFKKEADNVS